MEIDRHLKIDPVLWGRVKIEAVQSDVAISELVSSLLRDSLKPVRARVK